MNWLLGLICLLPSFFPGALQAQGNRPSEGSGNYNDLTLGVEAGGGTVTGYYHGNTGDSSSIDEPHFSCSFYLYGKKDGEKYAVQTWYPKDKIPILVPGKLQVLANEKGKSYVRLGLSQLPGGCWNVNPGLGKAEGARLSLEDAGSWSEVRVVMAPKSHFYDNPDPAMAKKAYVIRGDVVEVFEKKPGWARVGYQGKEKGWVKEADLFAVLPPGRDSVPVSSSK